MPRLASNRREGAMAARFIRGIGSMELQMLDVMLLALGLAFFALTIGYAYACDRL
jgi:hypothetical protein